MTSTFNSGCEYRTSSSSLSILISKHLSFLVATSYTSRHYYAMSIVGWPQPPEEWVKPIDMWSWQILWNLHKWLILFFTKPVSQLSLESVLHPVERNICTFLKFDTLFPHEQKTTTTREKREQKVGRHVAWLVFHCHCHCRVTVLPVVRSVVRLMHVTKFPFRVRNLWVA